MTSGFANRPLRISLDGAELDAAVLRCAASAFVRQMLDAPSLAEIAFAEPPADGLKALRFGAELALSVGSDAPLFKGEITTVEHQRDGAGGHVVRVRAYDRLHRLRKKQQARALAGMDVAGIAAQAASELGVGSAAAESGPARRLCVQYESSDLDFIVDLAREAGLHLYLDGDVLRLVTLAGEGEPVELKLGRELAAARSVLGVETMRRNVKAQAWNVLRTTVLGASVSLARQDAQDMRSLDMSSFADLGMRTLYNRLAADTSEIEGHAQADLDHAAVGRSGRRRQCRRRSQAASRPARSGSSASPTTSTVSSPSPKRCTASARATATSPNSRPRRRRAIRAAARRSSPSVSSSTSPIPTGCRGRARACR